MSKFQFLGILLVLCLLLIPEQYNTIRQIIVLYALFCLWLPYGYGMIKYLDKRASDEKYTKNMSKIKILPCFKFLFYGYDLSRSIFIVTAILQTLLFVLTVFLSCYFVAIIIGLLCGIFNVFYDEIYILLSNIIFAFGISLIILSLVWNFVVVVEHFFKKGQKINIIESSKLYKMSRKRVQEYKRQQEAVKSLKRYISFKEKGISYIDGKDYDNIQKMIQNNYLEVYCDLIVNEKNKNILVVYSKSDNHIVFQAPIRNRKN